jgi:hypothetical protein
MTASKISGQLVPPQPTEQNVLGTIEVTQDVAASLAAVIMNELTWAETVVEHELSALYDALESPARV